MMCIYVYIYKDIFRFLLTLPNVKKNSLGTSLG